MRQDSQEQLNKDSQKQVGRPCGTVHTCTVYEFYVHVYLYTCKYMCTCKEYTLYMHCIYMYCTCTYCKPATYIHTHSSMQPGTHNLQSKSKHACAIGHWITTYCRIFDGYSLENTYSVSWRNEDPYQFLLPFLSWNKCIRGKGAGFMWISPLRRSVSPLQRFVVVVVSLESKSLLPLFDII